MNQTFEMSEPIEATAKKAVFISLSSIMIILNGSILCFVNFSVTQKVIERVDRWIFSQNCILIILFSLNQIILSADAKLLFRFGTYCFTVLLITNSTLFILNFSLVYIGLMHFSAIKCDRIFAWLHELTRNLKFAVSSTLTVTVFIFSIYGFITYHFREQVFAKRPTSVSNSTEQLTCLIGPPNCYITFLMVFSFMPNLFLLLIYVIAANELRMRIKESKANHTRRDKNVIKKFYFNSILSLTLFLPLLLERILSLTCSLCLSTTVSLLLQIISMTTLAFHPLFMMLNHCKLRESLLGLFKK